MTEDRARLLELLEWAKKERSDWSERNADRYWQMCRVVQEAERLLTRPVVPAETRAHQICAEHLKQHTDMVNVPIQTVYEWLVRVQPPAVVPAETPACEHTFNLVAWKHHEKVGRHCSKCCAFAPAVVPAVPQDK